MAIFDLELEQLRRRTSAKWQRFEPDVLPMFVAEMDCAMPTAVAARLKQAIEDGDTGYPELPSYQQAFADFAAWCWDWQLDPANAQLTCDVMTGIREVLLATTAPGDAVVINTPIYPPFRSVLRLTGRRILEVPMGPDDRLDLAGLATAFAAQPRPKAYLLCSPHNPNGTVHSAAELAEVAKLAAANGVTVISDEIHAPLAGSEHTPFLKLPGAESAFVVTSASKSFNLAGLKAGLIIAGESAVARLREMPIWVAESASHLAVIAHSTALEQERDWLQQAGNEIRVNKQLLADELSRQLPMLKYRPSQGTYLAWLDCSPLGLADPTLQFHQVGRVRFSSGVDFDPVARQFVRINLATSTELIRQAVSKMASAVG